MRTASVTRKTTETSIEIHLNLDGEGIFSGTTGIGFFDHMLSSFAKHSGIDLTILKCEGDTYIDFHHLIEDLGIVIGRCFDTALGDKRGITRFGFASVPMDEALSQVSVDISGRGFLYIDKKFSRGKAGEFDMELLEVFFSSFAREAKITLHIDLIRGNNRHHIAESIFKALALALKNAIKVTSDSIPSTKGKLE